MRCFLLALALLVSMALPSSAGDRKEPPRAPSTSIKVEVRGALRVMEKADVVSAALARQLAKQPVKATVTASGMVLHLAFGDDGKLADLARTLDGKAVLITGELRRAYEGPISGLDPPRFDDYIQVTGLKAAD
jgi:hypothetical protein